MFRNLFSNQSQHDVIDRTLQVEVDFGNLAQYVNMVVLPIIVVVGLAGNFTAVFVILRTSLRLLPSNRLLVALAIFDAGFVLTNLMLWLEIIGYVNIHSGTRIGCKILTYLSQFCDMASVWLTVGVTFERFVILYYANLRKTLASNRFVYQYICVVILCSALLTLWSLLTAGIVEDSHGTYCDTTLDAMSYHILNILDTVLSCFLPSVIILGLTMAIAYRIGVFVSVGLPDDNISCNSFTSESVVAELSKQRRLPKEPPEYLRLTKPGDKKLLQQLVSLPSSDNRNRRRQSDGKPISSRALTRALLGVTTIYVMLNFPCYIIRVISSYLEADQTGTIFHLIEIVTYVAYYAHHACNFYFYTFFSPQMRKALCTILRDITYFVCICECCNFGGCMDIEEGEEDSAFPL